MGTSAETSSIDAPADPSSGTADARKRAGRELAILLALAALVLAAWHPVLAIGPVSDDFWLIGGLYDDEGTLEPSLLPSVAFAQREEWRGPGDFLRPVWRASYALDALVVAHWEGVLQAINLVLHTGCSFLVYRLVLAVLRARAPALLAGSLFAVFPTFPEAIAWGAARTDLLATGFLLAAAIAVARGRSRWLSALLLLLALGGKETAAVGAPLVTVIERTRAPARSSARAAWAGALRRSAWAWALVLAWIALRAALLGELVGGHGHQSVETYWSAEQWGKRALLIPRAAFPFAALFDGSLAGWMATLALVALAGAVAWRAIRRGGPAAHVLAIGGTVALLSLLPMHRLGIPSPGEVDPGTRHLYLVAAGWCPVLAAALHAIAGRPRDRSERAARLAMGAIALLGAASVTRTRALECVESGEVMRRVRDTLAVETRRGGEGPLVAHAPLETHGWLILFGNAFPRALAPPFAEPPLRATWVTSERALEVTGVDPSLLLLLVQPGVELRAFDRDGTYRESSGIPLPTLVRGRLVEEGSRFALEHAAEPFEAGTLDLAPLVGSFVEVRTSEWTMVDTGGGGLAEARGVRADEVVPWEPMLVREGERWVLRGPPESHMALLAGHAPGLFPLSGAGALRLAHPIVWTGFPLDANGRHGIERSELVPVGAESPGHLYVQPVMVDPVRVELGALHRIDY